MTARYTITSDEECGEVGGRSETAEAGEERERGIEFPNFFDDFQVPLARGLVDPTLRLLLALRPGAAVLAAWLGVAGNWQALQRAVN